MPAESSPRPRRDAVGPKGNAAALLAALLLAAGAACAGEPKSESVGAAFNWYYAASFGTGVYQFNDTTVTALNLPFTWTMREPTDAQWGWRLTVPVTMAFGNLDITSPDFSQVNTINLAGLMVMPGAEAVFPLQPHWRLRAFANLGGTWELDTNASALVYRAGLSTRYRVPGMSEPDLELGLKLVNAGFGASGDYGNPINEGRIGAAASIGFPAAPADARQVRLGAHWIGTNYFTRVRFRKPAGYTELHSEWEAGLSLIFRPGFRFLGASWDRIGLGYVKGADGLKGVRLVTEFPF
jgi:hypothetical protein